MIRIFALPFKFILYRFDYIISTIELYIPRVYDSYIYNLHILIVIRLLLTDLTLVLLFMNII